MILTRAQREALAKVYRRTYGIHYEAVGERPPNVPSYLRFRHTAIPELVGPAIMVPLAGMWLGIEPDGYTHS